MTECDVVLHKALHNTLQIHCILIALCNNPSFQLISHQNIALQLMLSFYFSLHYSTQPVTACKTHVATRIFFSSEIYLHKTLPCAIITFMALTGGNIFFTCIDHLSSKFGIGCTRPGRLFGWKD